MNKKRAQSTLEYTLVLAAIILAILAAITSSQGPIRQGLTNFLNQTGDMIGGIMDAFQ